MGQARAEQAAFDDEFPRVRPIRTSVGRGAVVGIDTAALAKEATMFIGETEEVGTIEPLVIPDVIVDDEAPVPAPPEEAPLAVAAAA